MGRRSLFTALNALVHTSDPAGGPATEMIPVIDDAFAVRVLDLAIRLGETMLVAGSPASEVTLTIVRVAGVYGLDPVHVDVTYNSITVAHHRSGEDRPITLMRVVRGAAPDHSRLQRLQALVAEIRSGLPLDAAALRFRGIRRTPFRYHQPVAVAAQALLAVGVAVMFGANWLVIVLSFLAAGVASGIVLMLAGLTVVGAAQDAIDGFALTAMGRILELVTQTLGVVLGILAGIETARVIGLGLEAPTEALPLGPVPLQFLGAGLIALAVAVINGAGLRIIVVSVALSVVAWLGYVAAASLGFETAAASGVGAFVGSLVGILAAYRLHVPSVAITTAAILPMVPGAAVFRGLLGVVESGDSPATLLTGFSTLAAAATVGIALAVGASLGIYLGQPLRASLGSVIRARARVR
ncbi:MAG: hypothetical protein K0S49_2886 [Microbacterium sp.]|nr:hypothetical protein [Microbacterium sp.]